MRKHGFKIAGLCVVAALGAMALIASIALAEENAHWDVNGAAIPANLLPEPQVKELENNHLILLARASGNQAFEILCTGMILEEGKLKEKGGSLGYAKFTGCIVKLGGTTLPACEPRVGTTLGVILTNQLKDLIVLHEPEPNVKVPLDRIEPETGEVIATITTSAECSLGANIKVIGKFYAKDFEEQFEVERFNHLFVEGPLTELWVFNKTNEHKATIDGSAIIRLVGEHLGLTWSGVPQ